jgi:hypothetical protein
MRVLSFVSMGLLACAAAPTRHEPPPGVPPSLAATTAPAESADAGPVEESAFCDTGPDASAPDAAADVYPCLVRAPADDGRCPSRAHYQWKAGCAPTLELIARLEQAGCERLGPDRAANLKHWCCARAVAPPTR